MYTQLYHKCHLNSKIANQMLPPTGQQNIYGSYSLQECKDYLYPCRASYFPSFRRGFLFALVRFVLLPSETGKYRRNRYFTEKCPSKSQRQLNYIMQSDWSEPFIKNISDREVISILYYVAVVNKSSSLLQMKRLPFCRFRSLCIVLNSVRGARPNWNQERSIRKQNFESKQFWATKRATVVDFKSKQIQVLVFEIRRRSQISTTTTTTTNNEQHTYIAIVVPLINNQGFKSVVKPGQISQPCQPQWNTPERNTNKIE